MTALNLARLTGPLEHFVPSRLSGSLVRRLATATLGVVLVSPYAALAAQGGDADSVILPSGRFALHGQVTYVEQETNSFAAPYRGPNSLSPDIGRETADLTLYLGARLWPGAELWLNPEIDQGFGLDNTLGVAGFPSGEAYKVGKKKPYFRLPRAFVRQTVNVGEASDTVEASANQFASTRSSDRWVFTIGKFGVPDVFDVNQYAHDPRSDFLNWAAVDAGSFDYAADAWGFTVGASAEWYHGAWTLRGGFFDLSDVPNSEHLEPGFHEFQLIGEVEHRHELLGHQGKLLITYFESHGRMGLLNDAMRLAERTDTPVDISAVRQFRTRVGVSLNLEQQLAPDLGLFARAGQAGGNVEAYEFTDIDRAMELGLSLKGARWHRGGDTVGLAAMVNGISATRERFLNAGGLGILVGDGQLAHPGAERIVETYYSAALYSQVSVSADFQRIVNPAYNRDRGPVSVVALRFHAQF
ncbi:MAG: carbohydrate porin [Proteobacteria bacterium]|nr:carbohydrate porin [Pseudomonadota bacterium]